MNNSDKYFKVITHCLRQTRRGFTLIELLVVISIILIVASVIFVGGSSGDGAKLSSSQRILSGIAGGARGQAILHSAETRLIIYSDSASNGQDDKKLRFFGIIYLDTEEFDDTGNEQWIAATQGTFLSEGIYFDPDLSRSNNWTEKTMRLEYPRASPQTPGNGDEFYYYSFKSNGTAADTGNPWLVIRAGTLEPVSGNLEVVFPADGEEKSELKAALILRRAGTTTMVNDPADID